MPKITAKQKKCQHGELDVEEVKGFYPEYDGFRITCRTCGLEDKVYTADRESALAMWKDVTDLIRGD